MNIEELKKIIDETFNTNVNAEMLVKYKNLILTTNLTTNITGFKNDSDIYSNLFYDGIVAYKNFKFNNQTILDIGSGAGIPGILLKIIFNNLKLTIIEANKKKCNFLQTVVNSLNLKEVIILKQRAENITIEQRNSFDIVTARAVAALNILLEILTPYCKVNGLIICPKSTKLQQELQQSENIIKVLNIQKINLYNFISLSQVNHQIVVFKKMNATSLKYPRTWSQIIKNKKE